MSKILPSHERQFHSFILGILQNVWDLAMIMNNKHLWMLPQLLRRFSVKSSAFYEQALQKHQLFAVVDRDVLCALVE